MYAQKQKDFDLVGCTSVEGRRVPYFCGTVEIAYVAGEDDSVLKKVISHERELSSVASNYN